MKNKEKLCIIGISALCIVVAVVLCITLIPKHNGGKPAESEAKETSSGTIVIDEPDKDTQSDETKDINEDDKLADDGKGRLSPEVETDDISKSGSTGEKAEDTNKTVTEQPIPNDEGKTGDCRNKGACCSHSRRRMGCSCYYRGDMPYRSDCRILLRYFL